MADQSLSHEIIQDLKRVASELGRAPTRYEYRDRGLGKYSEKQLMVVFGGFTPALQAAGLQSARDRKSPIKAEDIFGKDLDAHLKEHRAHPSRVKSASLMRYISTAIAGDLHFPFVNMTTLAAFYEFIHFAKPKRVIQVGDLYDMFSHSKFPASRNIYTPRQEMELGFAMAKEFWATVQKLSPGVECYQILGNHDVRPLRRLLETYPAGEIFFSIDRWFEFQGVKYISDPREELIIDGIVYHHGFRSKLGDHRDFNFRNSVVGHTHKGGVTFKQVREEVIWELNAGYMGDPISKALSYQPGKISHWTQGFGYIDEFGPRFIAL